jgi:predicted  nucleic acid-binding Zn-ribbon protein
LDEHDPAVAVASECSKLERELNAANKRIKRLEEAGDKMEAWLRDERLDAVQHTVSKWRKAKEAKL